MFDVSCFDLRFADVFPCLKWDVLRPVHGQVDMRLSHCLWSLMPQDNNDISVTYAKCLTHSPLQYHLRHCEWHWSIRKLPVTQNLRFIIVNTRFNYRILPTHSRWDFRFWRWRIRRWLSSGMLRPAVYVVNIDRRFRASYYLHHQRDPSKTSACVYGNPSVYELNSLNQNCS
jgi:hypothetical protein